MPDPRASDLGHARTLDPERWVERHGDALYRFALPRLNDRDLAADVVQETFLEAFRVRDAYEGRASERTWLVGILRHKILDRYRKAARERPEVEIEAVEDRAFDRRGHWKVRLGRWGGTPGADLEREEFWECLRRCVSRLPSGLSEAFLLREIDGLDGAEVCEILRISPENLWTRMHRARMLLRGCLGRNWFEEAGPGTGDRR